MRLEPAGDRRETLLGEPVSLPDFLCGQPAVIVRRAGVIELSNVLLEVALLPHGASQLEEHVLHREIVGNRAAIVARVCFGTSVAGERHERAFVDSF